jgi:hypothetical protein
MMLQHAFLQKPANKKLKKVPTKPTKKEREDNPTKYTAQYMKMYESEDTNNEIGQNKLGGLGIKAQKKQVEIRKYLQGKCKTVAQRTAQAKVFEAMLLEVKKKHNIQGRDHAEQMRIAKKRRLNNGKEVALPVPQEKVNLNYFSDSEGEGHEDPCEEEEVTEVAE